MHSVASPYFAGLDVSLLETAICVIDEDGIAVSEGSPGTLFAGRSCSSLRAPTKKDHLATLLLR
jgi:hypothetical protein